MTTPAPPRPPTSLDESLVEPARYGLRKAGAGAGKIMAGGAIAGGVVSSGFGTLLMLLASGGFFDGLGAFALAGGIVMALGGLLAFWGIGRADHKADGRAIERRLLKLVAAHGPLTDEAIAHRIRADVAAVRAAADGLVRRGALDVDINPESGLDVYTTPDTSNAALPPAEAQELRQFTARLDQAVQEAPAEVQAQVAEHAEEYR